MATHAGIYKPRYSYEDTSPSNPANQPITSWPSIIFNFLWDTAVHVASILGPVLCANRRRGAISVAVISISALALINSIVPKISDASGHIGNHKMARRESYGLFRDVAGRRWEVLRAKTRDVRRNQLPPVDPNRFAIPKDFYQNWEKEFYCPREKSVGGAIAIAGSAQEGSSWWLCNPAGIAGAHKARPAKKKRGGWLRKSKKVERGCLIYTSKRTSTLGFETALLITLRGPEKCEIHVFAPGGIPEGSLPEGIQFHHWGFKGSNAQIDAGQQYKTFQDTVTSLGHEDREIDLLVLDCMGCEWDIYRDLFNSKVDIMQIAMKLYGKPAIVNDLFYTMQANRYAIFHKEEPARTNVDGQNQFKYSFLKLSPDFYG